MNLYDIEQQLAALAAERDKALARAEAAEVALADHYRRMEQTLARLNEATGRVEARVKTLEAENANLFHRLKAAVEIIEANNLTDHNMLVEEPAK